jgi:hypothetical protein
VASSARDLRDRTGMRLVAGHAGAVAHGGTGEFLRMAGLALRAYPAAVWFVATFAQLVPTAHVPAFVRVARGTGRGEYRWLVWQATVAALACRVTDTLRGQGELLLMTPLAQVMLRQGDLEMMGRVTLLAGNSCVKGMIRGGDLMAVSTAPGDHLFLPRARMWIVAGQACGTRDALGMIGMDVPMALGASRSWIAAHVVRGVATRARGVRRHASGGQHQHVRVARATRHGTTRLEGMRLMTIHALGVAASKQRAFRHDRRLLAVAFAARGQCGRGRRVLLRVARRAHSVLRLAERGMRSADRTVTAGAGRGDRRLILMRTVTAHTLGRGVHDDSGDLTLCFGVTTCAVSWAVGLERAAIARVGLTRVAGEGVTIGAIGACRFTEALLSQPSGVFDACPVLVAGRAATRRYHADRSGIQLVTAVTGNALFDHVHPMTRDTSIGAPSQWHVNA